MNWQRSLKNKNLSNIDVTSNYLFNTILF